MPIKDKTEETKFALELFARKKTGDIVKEISNNDELAKFSRIRIENVIDAESDSKFSGFN